MKTKRFKTILNASVLGAGLTTTLSTPDSAHALVNMRDANYFGSWTDVDGSRLHPDLKARRFYSSRSRHQGMYGFGWCSDFETSVRKTHDGRVMLFECGSSTELSYSPVRNRGGVYTSPTRPKDEIYQGAGFYTRVSAEGVVQKFNSDGKLLAIADKSGRLLTIVRDRRGKVSETQIEGGAWIRFQYQGDRVAEIQDHTGEKISYRYQGDDLVEVKSSSGRSLHAYSYDEFHNMVRVDQLGQTRERIAYDPERDQVASLEASDGCKEKYTFTAGTPGRFVSEARKTCPGKSLDKSSTLARFDFWYSLDPMTNEHSLARMRITLPQQTTEIVFHPRFGQPVLVDRGGKRIRYTYDIFGTLLNETKEVAQ